ncbi:MAG: hypothetical protein HYX94_07680 [Chloroflexi bacterium]|nr:hypothetical protein [Chloroflexota bacterium]
MSMTNSEIEALVRDAIDLHLHVGMDILPRKYTVEELFLEERGKVGGAAVKSHSFPTVPDVVAARSFPGRTKDEMLLVGSVTLNYFTGGFNPSAIYAAAVMSRGYPVVVWFPTTHAENHLVKNHSMYEIPPDWVKDPAFTSRFKTEVKAIKVTDWAGNLIPKAWQVLNMMRDMGNCVLATGHLSWEEARKLSLEALNLGLKVMVTHPMQRDIDMPVEVQVELARKGAFIEFCYVMYLDRDHPEDYPPEDMVRQIHQIGVEQCFLSSDAGQVRNPGPSACLKAFVELLEPHGITKEEFETMMVRNPRRILGWRVEGRGGTG